MNMTFLIFFFKICFYGYGSLMKILRIIKDKGQRNYRLVLSIISSVLAKFIGIGSTLITMPITLQYLGAEKFGVWMLISGVLGFIAFSDLGIGMGLQNALSKAEGESETKLQKYYISNAYFILTIISFFISLLVLMVFHSIDINEGLNLNGDEDSLYALKYSVLTFLMGLPVSLIQRVLNGIQKSYLASFALMVGSILSLMSILISVYLDLGLIFLCVAFAVSPVLAQFAFSLVYFIKNPKHMPRIKSITMKYSKPLVSTGFWTVATQMIYTSKINGPIIIISSTLGMLAVAEFSVVQKFIFAVSAVISMGLQPLWAVYGEAYHSRDRKWIEIALRKSIQLTLILTFCASIILIVLGPYIIEVWLGGKVEVSREMIFYFSLWMVFSCLNVALTMLMNGTNHFKYQSKVSLFFVSVTLALLYFFTPQYGLLFAVLTIFLVSELAVTPFYIYECRRIISEISV